MIYPYKNENFVSIGELFINPKYRHHGFGTLLIKYAEYLSINKYRVKFITIGVEKYNTAAYKLYTKLGFEKYDNWKDYSQESGRILSDIYGIDFETAKIAITKDKKVKLSTESGVSATIPFNSYILADIIKSTK